MKTYVNKVDNLPSDSTGVVTADDINNVIDELQNAIATSGQTLSGSDLYQIAKAMSDYAAAGNYYQDSGTANTYTLSVIGTMRAPHAYVDGMKVRFFAANSNTSGSTVNAATIGSKNIKRADGTALQANDIQAGAAIELTYRVSVDYFILTQAVLVTGDQTIQNNKTFTNAPLLSADPVGGTGAVRKSYADSTYVALTGNQTIAGVKTFSSVPASSADPAGATDLVRLSYMQSYVADNLLPAKFIGGSTPKYASASTLTLPAGMIVRDSTNAHNIITTADLTLNIAASGANGLDTGAEASSTWYYVYLIKKSSDGTVASLFSVTNENVSGTITLPSGYDIKRQLPLAVRNDGSSNFYSFIITNWSLKARIALNGVAFTYYDGSAYQVSSATNVINNGTATSYTTINCSSLVPPISRRAEFYGATTASGRFRNRPAGAAYEGISIGSGNGNEEGMWFQCDLSSSQQLEYIRQASATNGYYLDVCAWIVTEL